MGLTITAYTCSYGIVYLMRTYVFVDASNLFYGFDNEYGWRIDYNRFRKYFEDKYGATHVFYFGGIDIKLSCQTRNFSTITPRTIRSI